MTLGTLWKAVKLYLNHQEKKKQVKQAAKNAKKNQPKQGKITVKELAAQNAGMTNIEITDKNIKGLERYARYYGINYALKKDKTKDPPVYMVFFKGRDQDAITAAFRDFSNAQIKKANRPTIRKRRQKYRALVAGQKRNKVKQKHQQQSR